MHQKEEKIRNRILLEFIFVSPDFVNILVYAGDCWQEAAWSRVTNRDLSGHSTGEPASDRICLVQPWVNIFLLNAVGEKSRKTIISVISN